MAGLGLGSLITSPSNSARTGGISPQLYSVPPCLSLDTPVPLIRRGRHSRTETISRNLPRLLRHGPRADEAPLDIILFDDGNVIIADLARRPTFGKMHVSQAEIITISNGRDSDRKNRCDLQATLYGPKMRCHQGHTLPVTRAPDTRTLAHQSYLKHATEPEAAAPILLSGMKQMRNRQELHFVELQYDERQSHYIVNSRHSRTRRVWLVLDTQLAAGLGYTFRKLDNGLGVCAGHEGIIRHSVFVSACLSDTQRISIDELLQSGHKLVTIDQEDAHPPPKRNASARSDAGQRSMSPPCLSPPIPALSVSDYQPTSPTPSQLELPELERPPSWSPADVSPPPKRTRLGGNHAKPELAILPPPAVTSSASTHVGPPFTLRGSCKR